MANTFICRGVMLKVKGSKIEKEYLAFFVHKIFSFRYMKWIATVFIFLLQPDFLLAERLLKTCEATDMDDRNALFSVHREAEFYLFPAEGEIPLRDYPPRRKILLTAWVSADNMDTEFFIPSRVKLKDSAGNEIGETITYQSVHDSRIDEDGIKVWLVGYIPYACIDKSTIAERWLEKALAVPQQAIYRDSLLAFIRDFRPVVNKSKADFEEWRLDEQLPEGLRIQLVFHQNILQRGVFSRPVSIKTRESSVHERGRHVYYFQHLDDKSKERLKKAFPL